MTAPWSDARDAELRRLWANGAYTNIIAAAISSIDRDLGTVTRNAVIGRARRLKLGTHQHVQNKCAASEIKKAKEKIKKAEKKLLPTVMERKANTTRNYRRLVENNNDAKNNKKKINWAQNTKPVAVVPVDASLVAKKDFKIPVEQRRTLTGLEFGKCRWPVGDPLKSDFFFCGNDAVTGLSYCAGHAQRAHR